MRQSEMVQDAWQGSRVNRRRKNGFFYFLAICELDSTPGEVKGQKKNNNGFRVGAYWEILSLSPRKYLEGLSEVCHGFLLRLTSYYFCKHHLHSESLQAFDIFSPCQIVGNQNVDTR